MDFNEVASEETVLGIILRNGHLIFEVQSKLKPYMFSSQINAIIYRAMVSVSQNGNDASFILVQGELEDKNHIKDVGGKEYLEYLYANTGSEKDVDAYVERIRNVYKKRALINLNAKMPSIIERYDADLVISDLNTRLNGLITESGGFDVRILGDTIGETFANILRRRENPGINGISTGYAELDFYTGGLVPGTNWYIGARPSMCKSALLGRLFLNIAKQKIPALLFNKEMSPERINERWLSNISGVDAIKIRFGTLDDEEIARLQRARDQLAELPIYIDHNYAGDIDYITSTIRKYHQLHGIAVVGIDYLQLVVERSGESTHELGRASRALKLLSNELNIASVVLSQVNRECEKRENKRPLMADLRQSGNLEEDADIMIALYREEAYIENTPEEGKLEVIVRKSRDGPTGTIILNFDKNTVNIFDRINIQGVYTDEIRSS